MDLELQSQDSSSNHREFSHWAALLDLGTWVSGFLSSPLSQLQEHTGGEGRGMEDWLLRAREVCGVRGVARGEGLGLTRLSSSGLEENSGLSERI